MKELRQKAADLIINRLEDTENPITIAQAASDLQTSRQAIYDIKKRKYCPSLSLVHRACEVWGLTFEYAGIVVEKASFQRKRAETPQAPSSQLNFDLVEAICQLDHRNFEVVEAKPMGRTLEIILRLTVPTDKVG